MKKLISGIISMVMAGSMLGVTAGAQVTVDPKYPLNGNKCGTVVVESEIERDVHITIVQNSPDGKYSYYEEIIPESADDKTYEFILEGKNDVDYTVTISVAKYKGASDLEEFIDVITVNDIDEIVSDDIAGYTYTYTVNMNEEEAVESKITKEDVKDSNNFIVNETTVLFPVLEQMLGDANADGQLNIRDAAAIARALATSEELPECADFNCDSKVNVRDAAAIAAALA